MHILHTFQDATQLSSLYDDRVNCACLFPMLLLLRFGRHVAFMNRNAIKEYNFGIFIRRTTKRNVKSLVPYDITKDK